MLHLKSKKHFLPQRMQGRLYRLLARFTYLGQESKKIKAKEKQNNDK